MAVPSEEYVPEPHDKKIEDEQVEHNYPLEAQYIETKYAGRSLIVMMLYLLTISKTWADGVPPKCFGEYLFSAPSCFGPV
jgi:hypothetical protein